MNIYDVSWHVSFPRLKRRLDFTSVVPEADGYFQALPGSSMVEDPTEERAAFVAPPEFQQIRILGAQHGHSA